MTAADWSSLTISLDQNVILHRSLFPPFNWPTYLADLGGTVGLWLGLGIMQLIQMLVDRVLSSVHFMKVYFLTQLIVLTQQTIRTHTDEGLV